MRRAGSTPSIPTVRQSAVVFLRHVVTGPDSRACSVFCGHSSTKRSPRMSLRWPDSCALQHVVDCLIEIVESTDHRLLRLSGRLTAAQAHELLDASRGAHRPVHLDLRELISVDAIGLEVLHDLQHDGARLFDVPTYIQLKLDSLSSKRGKRGC